MRRRPELRAVAAWTRSSLSSARLTGNGVAGLPRSMSSPTARASAAGSPRSSSRVGASRAAARARRPLVGSLSRSLGAWLKARPFRPRRCRYGVGGVCGSVGREDAAVADGLCRRSDDRSRMSCDASRRSWTGARARRRARLQARPRRTAWRRSGGAGQARAGFLVWRGLPSMRATLNEAGWVLRRPVPGVHESGELSNHISGLECHRCPKTKTAPHVVAAAARFTAHRDRRRRAEVGPPTWSWSPTASAPGSVSTGTSMPGSIAFAAAESPCPSARSRRHPRSDTREVVESDGRRVRAQRARGRSAGWLSRPSTEDHIDAPARGTGSPAR
jgi:hypothetical protein